MAFDRNQPFTEAEPVSTLDRSKPFEEVSHDEGLTNALFDLDGAPDRVGPEGKAAFQALEVQTDNSKETKAQAVNQAYVQREMGIGPDILQQDWPAFRDSFAKSLGHTEGTISEGKFYDLATKQEQKTLKQRFAEGSTWDRLKMFFGSHGYGPTEVEGAVPMIGSEASGTKGGAFTIPKMEGTGTMVGLINAANKLTSGLTTPENAGIMVATGGAGALAEIVPLTRAAIVLRSTQAAALGTFTVIGAKDTVNAAAEAKIVFNDPKATNADKADAIATAVLSGAMTIAAAKGTYDFSVQAKAEAGAIDANAARMESIRHLREEAAKSEPKTAETLNKVADEIEALAPIVEEKPPAKAGEATVEDLDGGGFVVTDKDGNRAYSQDRAEADALAKELGAKADTKTNDRAEYDRLQKNMADLGYDKAGTHEFNQLWQKSENIKNRNEGMPPEKKAAEPVKEVPVTEAVKTPEAVQESVNAAKQAVVGIKNASVDEALAKMGMDPATHGEKLSFEEARQDAAAKMEKDPLAGQKLIQQLEAEPRPVTGKENALLLHELTRLTNERAAAETALIEAVNQGDPIAVADAKVRVQQAQTDYVRAADIDTKVGTANAIGLSLRRMMMKEDYSLAAMERRRVVANEGKPLNPEKQAEVVQISEELAAVAKDREAHQKERANTPTAKKGKLLKFINEQADAARERVRQRLEKAATSQFVEGEKNSGIFSQENLVDLATIGAEYIAKGAVKLAEWSEAMVKEFGESIQPHLKEIYDKAVAKLDDSKTESRYAQKKAKLEATIKKLQEKVDLGDTSREPVKANRPEVAEIERLSQERDGLQEKLTAMRATETKVADLESAIAEKTKKIEGGDLSAKGQPVNRPSTAEIETLKQQRDALNRDLTEARKEAAKPTEADRVKKEVEALQERIAEKKAAIDSGDVAPKGQAANRPAVQAIEEAKQELADLNQKIAELRNPEKTPQQKKLAQVEAQIARVEEQIESGELFTPGKKVSASSPEITAAEAKLKELVRQRDDLRETIQPSADPKTAQEKRLAAFKAQRERSTKELARRIKEGDFEPKAKPEELHLDERANELQAKEDLLKLEYDRLLERDRYENLSPLQKVGENVLVGWDSSRAILAGFEFSVVARQGGVRLFSHPIKTIQSLGDAFRALVSNEEGAHAINLKTLNDPAAAEAISNKLPLVDEKSKLSKQEEIYMGKLVGKIPGVKNFEQFAHVFLNKMRLDMWKEMRQSFPDASPRLTADFIASATGRGSLGKLEMNAVMLNRVLFSPKFMASRVQMGSGYYIWKAALKGDTAAVKMVSKQYAQTMIGYSIFLSALYAGFKAYTNEPVSIGLTPNSSEFMKLKVGKTRIDLAAGVQQPLVFLNRLATGKTTNAMDKETAVQGGQVERFIRSKLNPSASKIYDVIPGLGGGKNAVGQPATGWDLLYPATYGDIVNAFEEHDVPEATAISILGLFGAGINTYDPKKPKPAKK